MLVVWADKMHPWAEGRLLELEQACLVWHRREDKPRRSWYGAVQVWITGQPAIDRDRGQEKPRPRKMAPTVADMPPEERAEWDEMERRRAKHTAERKADAPPGSMSEAEWLGVTKA